MTDETALAVQEQRGEWLPAMTVKQATQRYAEMQKFVKKVLKESVDFGVIPGTDKPTLLKAGAEKFALFFGLGIEHELVDCTEDWEHGFFNYRYKVVARDLRSGKIKATGEGSCNSMEKKYRIRHIPEFKATAEEKANVIRSEEKTSKKGNKYTMLTVENDDPYSIVNTLQKMAYKRALVAAVLVAANASDYFTQDMEDMAPEVINGDFREVPVSTGKRNESQWPEQDILKKLIDLQLTDAKPHAVHILNKSPFMNVAPGKLELLETVAYFVGHAMIKADLPDLPFDERTEHLNKTWAEDHSTWTEKAIEMLGGE